MKEEFKFDIEMWSVDDILEYEDNAKIHDKKQIKDLAKNIKKFGLTQPVSLETDGTIIAGHGRTLAMKSLGWKKIPVIVRRDLSADEARALRLSDNRLSSNDYDTNLLQKEVSALAELSIELDDSLLDGLGFDDKELEMFTVDLGDMVDLNDDLSFDRQVENQSDETSASMDVHDKDLIKIKDSMGFDTVTIGQNRTIQRFMAEVNDTVDAEDGADSFVGFIEQVSE